MSDMREDVAIAMDLAIGDGHEAHWEPMPLVVADAAIAAMEPHIEARVAEAVQAERARVFAGLIAEFDGLARNCRELGETQRIQTWGTTEDAQ